MKIKTNYSESNRKYRRAKKRVECLKGFYGSVTAYCLVMPLLVFINYRTHWEFQWFWFPLFGWGLGIVIQAFKIYGYGSDWEERKIQEIMEKDKN